MISLIALLLSFAQAAVVYGPAAAPPVTNLSGRPVSGTAPTSGQVISWNSTSGQWEPAAGGGGSLGADIDLASAEVTGVLPIANGGTNKALTLSAGGIPWVDADSFEILAAGAAGKILTSGGASAPTWEDAPAGASQWTTDASGIYYTPPSADIVRIGVSAVVTGAATLQVMVPDNNSYSAFFGSSYDGGGGTDNGALGIINLGDISGTIFDFSVDFQGLNSDNTGVAPMNLNRQGGDVNIGSGAGTVVFPSLGDGNLSVASEVLTSASDARLKDVQGPYERGLDDLRKFKGPKIYKWKKERPEGKNGFNHAGFIAQEVEETFPECVFEGPDGMLSLSTTCVLAVALNAIKDLDGQCVKKADLPEPKVIPAPARQKSKPVETTCVGSKDFCAGLKKTSALKSK